MLGVKMSIFELVLDRNPCSLFFFLCFLTFAFVSFIKASEITVASHESDRIVNLPGQPSAPLISQFSGYITVNQENGRALFYWFFEAQSQPSKKPLLLWLNGGPGCSSIGYGAAVEIGPLLVNENGDGLHFNTYSWYQEANLLFVESPVGVGFSYSNTSSDLTMLDDNFVAEDAYNFLVNWLQKFPQYNSSDFFISGESYAGHYIPQLAELVFDRNKQRPKNLFINLKGFIVGNPETNDYYDNKALLEYAWSHSVISDQLYEKGEQVCDFKKSNWSKDCDDVMVDVFREYTEIDIYNIYGPVCPKLLPLTINSALRAHNSPKTFSKLKLLNADMNFRNRNRPNGDSPGKQAQLPSFDLQKAFTDFQCHCSNLFQKLTHLPFINPDSFPFKTHVQNTIFSLQSQAQHVFDGKVSSLFQGTCPSSGKGAFLARINQTQASPVRQSGVGMTVEAIEERLAGVPVYALSNAAEEFVLVSGTSTGNSLGLFCFKREDAETLLEQIKVMDPSAQTGSKVVPVALNKVFQLKVDGVAFRLIPDCSQVKYALKEREKAGFLDNAFSGVPVFQSRSLILRSQDKSYRPLFFRKEDLENSLQRASRQQNQLNPAFRPGDIQVAVLEDVINGMKDGSTSNWEDVVFIPPGFDVSTNPTQQ